MLGQSESWCYYGMRAGTVHGSYIWRVWRNTVKSSAYLHALGKCIEILRVSTNSFRYGLRGRELIRFVGKSMFQTAGTIAVFIGIGSAIRC